MYIVKVCTVVFWFLQHSFRILTSQRLNSVMKCHEVESLFQYDVPGVLRVRVPGTTEHDVVKDVCMLVCVESRVSLISV